MKIAYAAGALAGLLALGAAAANAAEMPERELGVLFGAGWADKNLVGGKDDEPNPLLGLRYGQRLGTSTNFFGDLVYGKYDGNRAGVGDSDVTTLRGGLEWLFSKQQRYNWFLSGGLGLVNVNTDNGPDFTRPLVSVGIGQAWAVGANDAFRWEVRADQAMGNDSLPGSGLTNFQALLGYSWGIGAPLDSDGDGVPNRADQCPNTPKGAKVDAKGCPLDSDGDGVFDGLDKCPGTPAGVKVNADGCPLDTDGDGIPDYLDKCPTVPAPGTPDGCPPPAVEKPAEPAPAPVDTTPRKLVLEGVNFSTDSSKLAPGSVAILDNAAATLKGWDDVKVMIEVAGHTDSTGSAAYNQKLSERRANTVRAYLIDKGIAADRLIAKGYGETQPVADNKTRDGRYKNRRVELIPLK
ncbi:MAG: OmpA family protein [Pseudomonadota bacterium]